MRTFVELFSGGGMARLGLGDGWRCSLACEIDAAKAAAYRTNFGGGEVRECDVRDLSAADVPGRPDLLWASFPCQDLSAAAARSGPRSSWCGTCASRDARPGSRRSRTSRGC